GLFKRGTNSRIRLSVSCARKQADSLIPAGRAFVRIGLRVPRALVHRECRETIATQLGQFLRSVFGVEIVTANTASLISTVEEYDQFQAAHRLRASGHSTSNGFLDSKVSVQRIRRELVC